MRTRYTDFVRGYPCCVCGSRAQPHHVRTTGSQGRQIDEGNVVPLCAHHHTGGAGVHYLGKRTFARKFRVCLPAVALSILADWLQHEEGLGY